MILVCPRTRATKPLGREELGKIDARYFEPNKHQSKANLMVKTRGVWNEGYERRVGPYSQHTVFPAKNAVGQCATTQVIAINGDGCEIRLATLYGATKR